MQHIQDPLISVIMPAYNAAKTIRRAIDSVLGQTYANIELIVIDDGSADDTAAIANSYTDRRLKVISQDNKGESAARNRALDSITGQYVCFIDSDDWYDDNFIEALYTAISSADNIGTAIAPVCNHHGSYSLTAKITGKVYRDFADCITDSDMLYTGQLNSTCNKIYRRDVIEANKIRFKKTPNAEDIEFNLTYCHNIGAIATTNATAYNYDKTMSVLTTRVDESHYRSYLWIQKLFGDLYGDRLADKVNDFFYTQYLAITIKFLTKSANDSSGKHKVNSILKAYLSEPVIKKTFDRHRCTNIKEGILHYAIRYKMFGLLNLYLRRKNG